MFFLRSSLCVTSIGVGLTVLGTGCATGDLKRTVIGLERAALDRWGKGDTGGYLDLSAAEITYFDPDLQRRLSGLDSLRSLLTPLDGKIKIERYEMIDPKVEIHGKVAVLTFDLIDYVRAPDGSMTRSCWHSTEVYRRQDGQWKIIHSHWSQPKEGEKTE